MTSYEFLIDAFDRHRMIERVTARDDSEARSLAEIRLLLSGDFVSIAVLKRGKPRFELHRDSPCGWSDATGSQAAAFRPGK